MIRSFPLPRRLRRKMAAAVAVALTAFLPLAAPTAPTAQASDGVVRKADAAGGYWMVASDGGIFSFGAAPFYGSTGDIRLNQPIVGMAATPSGKGYWFVAADGGIFSFGDAGFHGSTGNLKLNKPIVGMAPTPSGKGYWFVASDGGIFAFGDAGFHGSTGNLKLDRPITAMATSPSGKGYWFTASDGGVFSFGDAKFFGAQPKADRTISAMVPAPDGAGYWMASSMGELLSFGSAPNLGGLTKKPNLPIVGMTAAPLTAVGPTGTTQPGTNPTPTTGPTTGTTLPPYSGPMRFSSVALHSWGTPADASKSRVNGATTEAECTRGVWENGQCRVFPYSEKVASVVEIGDRVYIGGSFTNMHQNNHPKTPTMADPPMDYVAELDTNGNPVPGSAFNANVSFEGGPVRVVQRSADGRRLYVGGEFTRVNGQNRRRIVALDPATGQIDTSFSPPEPNAYVSAIVEHGSRVYIGGAFISFNSGSATAPGLAALNLDGSLNSGFTAPPRYPGRFEGQGGTRVENPTSGDTTGTVDSLLMTRDGKYLMVGGSFLHFGYDHTADSGHKHSGLIAVDPATGGLTTWQPTFGSSSKGSRPVFGMASYNGNPRDLGIDSSLLVFTATGGAGGRVIAWTPGGSTAQLWRAGVDGDALGVAVTQDRVYLVGHFDYALTDADDPCLQKVPVSCPVGTPHRHLVAWDARGEVIDGKHTGKAVFDPDFTAQADTSEGPYTVHLGANRMYVGGNFTDVANFPTTSGCPWPETSRCVEGRQPGFAVYPPLQ